MEGEGEVLWERPHRPQRDRQEGRRHDHRRADQIRRVEGIIIININNYINIYYHFLVGLHHVPPEVPARRGVPIPVQGGASTLRPTSPSFLH